VGLDISPDTITAITAITADTTIARLTNTTPRRWLCAALPTAQPLAPTAIAAESIE